ncbi:MAG: NAD(P)/FAD-dependent oxidoreductase [Candidatus Thermoplasmatota archaeon]|nr:NAD(P)/FAD-dependent oxidoreductase [Candidatus Thermoplasmatota archaeon]
MQKDCDVAVVGGGPTGGYVAGKIAAEGYKVAIFEQHKQIGEPLNCAGLITSRVFDIINLLEKPVVQNKIKGAHIHSPSGHTLTIGGDKVRALVINRSMFDREIIKISVEKGAELFLENKVISAQKTKNHVELKTSKKNDIKCKLLIGADGPHSKIRDLFALPNPTEFLRGMGAEITDTTLDPDFVEILVGKNIAPGFFAWVIPTNDKGTEARIGLCVRENAPYQLGHYFSNLFKNKVISSYLKNVEITKKMGGIIPLGVLKKTYDANMLILGDAAAQVKPTSGGGIYPGLLCANRCSSVAIEALQKNDFTLRTLKKYHKLWSADIGKELYVGMKFRKIFKSLTDDQMDKYIEKFQSEKITKIISKYGDIDYPSKLAKHLLKKAPSLIKLLPNLMK